MGDWVYTYPLPLGLLSSSPHRHSGEGSAPWRYVARYDDRCAIHQPVGTTRIFVRRHLRQVADELTLPRCRMVVELTSSRVEAQILAETRSRPGNTRV